MYAKKNKKDKNRYPGTDVMPWKVIDHEGREKGIWVLHKDGTREYQTRWLRYSTASAVARQTRGVAVRA